VFSHAHLWPVTESPKGIMTLPDSDGQVRKQTVKLNQWQIQKAG